jgi:hypothetical protein
MFSTGRLNVGGKSWSKTGVLQQRRRLDGFVVLHTLLKIAGQFQSNVRRFAGVSCLRKRTSQIADHQ